MTLAIDVIDVSIQTSRILRHVSLSVGAGELVCLVGRNGAGKTTIMETLVQAARRIGVKGIIQVEHDMDIVFAYSDRIVALHQGRVLADATPDAIRADDEVVATVLGRPR